MKREFVLKGLNCAQCANKIEEEINQKQGVEATINFMTKTLTIQIKPEDDDEELLRRLNDIVHKHEPETHVLKKSDSMAQRNDAEVKNSKKEMLKEKKRELFLLSTGGVFFVLGFVLRGRIESYWIMFLISYLLTGGEVLLRAGKNIFRGQIFDENFLMGIATIGAFAIGEYAEGAAVMIFYQIGEMFQDMAVDRSRKSIAALMDIRPEYANAMIEGQLVRVDPKQLQIGEKFAVKAGEKVPLDGVVVRGESFLDTSALTGEAYPRKVKAGDEVLSGSVNQGGMLHVRVTKKYEESTVIKILELVENAANKKAPTEKFITKFAKVYTPIVVGLAVAIALLPPLLTNQSFQTWIYRALLFLVISCPCALVISVPLGFFGGIGAASKNGILIKGGNYLEALSSVDTVIFDKTGTLTKGVFAVTKIEAENGFTGDELLHYAAAAETYSTHPIAQSIQKAYKKNILKSQVSSYSEMAGMGVAATMDNRRILAGNEKLMDNYRIDIKKVAEDDTVVYVAIDGLYAGAILIADEVKDGAKETVNKLGQAGVSKTVMLTGDAKKAARHFAQMLKIEEVYAQLLPNEKVDKIEEIKKNKKTKGQIVFVGDGINDAPALAVADVGIAMGGIGSDAAIEAADVVIMTDELEKIAKTIDLSRQTKKIVQQNIVFALGVKALVLALGAMGFATMWEAVFADVGVALLAVLNSMRALRL